MTVFIDNLVDPPRNLVRGIAKRVAGGLNRLSGGRLHPNTVTIVGLLAHAPIAYLIATAHPWRAALLLVIFGLFDALDGELARLQKSASATGMMLDSVTDRFKEVLLYCGIAAFLVSTQDYNASVAAVGALGASLCVSYINAWGEVVMHARNTATPTLNKTFRSGLLSFDLRMLIIVLGLLLGRLSEAVYLILVLASVTIVQRLLLITSRLKDV